MLSSVTAMLTDFENHFSTWVTAGLTVATGLFWFFCWPLWHRRRQVTSPPGPRGLPLLGYLPFIDPKAPYNTLCQLAKRYGPVYSLKLGSVNAIVLSDPQLIRRAFAQDVFSGRAPLYLTHGIMQGYGLICAEGKAWREQRRFMTGVMRELGLSRSKGDGQTLLEDRFMDRIQEFLQDLREAKGQPKDVVPKLRHCIGNIMNSFIFGVQYAETDPTWIWLQHLLDEGFKHVAVAGPLNFLPFLRFLPKYRRTMSFILGGKVETHKHYQEVIDEHKSRLNLEYPHFENVIEAYLLEMNRRTNPEGSFTTQQLYHVLADLFGAGTDTAMTTVKWVLLYVIKYPEVQARMQEELDRVVGQNTLNLSYLSLLPYSEAVICETQRIKNVLPLGVPHGTLEDTEIGGFAVTKHTMVIPLLWAINLNPTLWSEPHIFRPERFLDQDTGHVRKPDYFMPFQTGRRVCLGEELGRTTVFMFVASLLQKFTLTMPSDVNYDTDQVHDYGFTLVPKPYLVVAKERNA